MAKQNNPASRLWTVLNNGKRKELLGKRVGDVWAELLNVHPGNQPLLLHRIGILFDLPNMIESAIKQSDDIDTQLYLKWLPTIKTSFRQLNFETQWATFMSPIGENILDGIAYCADHLSRKYPEPMVNERDLKTIREDALALLKKINESFITSDAQLFMEEKIQAILNAIEEYRIAGVAPLRRVVEESVGAITTLQPETHHHMMKTKEGREFWTIVGRVAIVLSITWNSFQIGSEIRNLLREPKQAIVEVEKSENTRQVKAKPESKAMAGVKIIES